MFPEAMLFRFVLENLSEEIAGYQPQAPNPLPCDRYVARSCFQKAIRRREAALAQRAMANLYDHDARSVWRHAIIVALEDCGAVSIDTLSQLVAARLDRKWCGRMGGEWRVLSFLVERMSTGNHCQAACDLLLCALNRPDLENVRARALEADVAELAAILSDNQQPLEIRGIATLALGGGLADGQQHNRPSCVFAIMAEQGYSSHVVATCYAAWRASRNEMALLMPLIWQAWMANDEYQVEDDNIPPVTMVGELPDYTLDQFTRIGNKAYRSYLNEDPGLRVLLVDAGVPAAQQPRAIGDLMFLIDGSPISRRAIWKTGDGLRLPYRMLPWIARMTERQTIILAQIADKACQIALARADNYHRAQKIGTA